MMTLGVGNIVAPGVGNMMALITHQGGEYRGPRQFYRVAQAISETLLNESKEKKLLDGFLAGRQRVSDEITRRVAEPQQGYLFNDRKRK